MDGLLEKSRDLDQDVFRNIVSLRKSEDLFDDLTDGDPALSTLAMHAEMRVKSDIPSGLIQRSFHYSTAIGYPFETEPFMASRYGDGTFGVWYGSMDANTTIEETAYHMMRVESGIEGVGEIVVRERAIYRIHCRALMIDIVDKEEDYPQLIADDYEFTQQLARRLHREGHPGLLAPSARCEGTNVVVFNSAVLMDPRVSSYLTYAFDPHKKVVRVKTASGKTTKLVTWERDKILA